MVRGQFVYVTNCICAATPVRDSCSFNVCRKHALGDEFVRTIQLSETEQHVTERYASHGPLIQRAVERHLLRYTHNRPMIQWAVLAHIGPDKAAVEMDTSN
jgi:hypothetical protein